MTVTSFHSFLLHYNSFCVKWIWSSTRYFCNWVMGELNRWWPHIWIMFNRIYLCDLWSLSYKVITSHHSVVFFSFLFFSQCSFHRLFLGISHTGSTHLALWQRSRARGHSRIWRKPIVFGHKSMWLLEQKKGLKFMNPGACLLWRTFLIIWYVKL